MFRDLRYSLRLLHRSPGFTVTAVCTFAVAIGVNIAVFNVVDRVLLQPLAIRDANHVVIIWPREKANPTTVGEVSYWAFRAWQQQARSFETLAAIGSVNWSLSALAIGLAALGVYGIVSQSTVDRMREIAIRTALGAGSGHILRLVVADGVVFTTLGIGVGLALGVSARRVLSGLLFGVRAADPMTLAVIPMLFLGVALIGMLLPVRRALRVDPAVALRQE
jgi:ABC-type lipoprotein release transport system permease subunit